MSSVACVVACYLAATASAGPPPAIATAAAVGPYGGRLIQSPSIIVRDQGASAPLDGVFAGMNGKSAWIFGDTLLSAGSPGANCDRFAVDTQAFSGRAADTGIGVGFDYADSTGAPTEFLPMTAAEARYNTDHYARDRCVNKTIPARCRSPVYGLCSAEYLPNAGAVIADRARRRLLFFFDVSWRLRELTTGPIPAYRAGTVGAAVASWSPTQRPQLQRLYFRISGAGQPRPYAFGDGKPPSDDPNPVGGVDYRGPQYGQAPVIPPGQSRYLYLYDTNPSSPRPDCGLAYCYKPKLARVPLATLTDLSTWRFFNATSPSDPWKPRMGQATYLPTTESGRVATAGPPNFSVTYNGYLRKYVMFYQRILTRTIGYRTASNPWGPWSAEGTVPFREVLPGPGGLSYGAQAHDEFSRQGGKVMYLTYTAANTAGGVYVARVTFR